MWALLACQAPFGADRHELAGFRIAAVAIADGAAWQPRAALVTTGPYAASPVDLAWFAVVAPDDVAQIDPDVATPLAQGATPSLPPGPHALGLVARWEGQRADAFVDPRIAGAAPRLDGIALGQLDLTVADLVGKAWTELSAVPDRAASRLAADGVARARADVDVGTTMRWMSTSGTWAEEEPAASLWVPAVVTLDDGLIERAVPDRAGIVTWLGLALRDGATAWNLRDVAVGDGADAVAIQVSGRLLPTDLAAPPTRPLVYGFVEPDDGPAGMRLVDAVEIDIDTSDPVACGDGGRFDPTWLVDGRCDVATLTGHVVVVAPDP